MFTTFAEIYNEIARQAKDDTVNGIANAKRWANAGYNRVVYDVDYPFLRRETTFTTTNGTRLYIPSVIALRILNIRIPSENRYLTKIDAERLDRARPQYKVDTQVDIPLGWYIEDFVGVATQPPSAEVCGVKSSSASDTTQTVTVTGIVNGEVDQATATLNGTTNVSLVKSFTEIHSISKSAITVGQITFGTNSTYTTTYGILGPMHRTKRYIRIGLEPIPGSTLTCYMKFTPWMPEMVNDSDVTLIPASDTPLIVDAGLMHAYEFLGDMDSLMQREKKYIDRLGKIRERMGDDQDTVEGWKTSGGRMNYPVIAGDYTSALRNWFWGN